MVMILRFCFFILISTSGITGFSQKDDLSAIYSTGINNSLKNYEKHKVFIMDPTVNYYSKKLKQMIYYLHIQREKLDSSWLPVYNNFDTPMFDISNKFLASRNIISLSGKQKQLILHNPKKAFWEVVFEKFPGFSGVAFVSPIYFNINHTRAIFGCEILVNKCGTGAFTSYELKMNGHGSWEIVWRRN